MATPYIGHWGTRRGSQVRFAKGLALTGFGTPVELDPSQKLTTLRFLRRGDHINDGQAVYAICDLHLGDVGILNVYSYVGIPKVYSYG